MSTMPTMQYRRLGTAGIQVSAIAVGGWINFGEGIMAAENARHIIETAYANGINFFDPADVYERGKAETQIGAVLKHYPRHTLVISSKVFYPMSDEVNDRGLSRKHIMESIDKSLQRIGTDYLDIYFCHRFDPTTPLLETVRAMDDLIHQGKVLYWGTSEWPAAEIQAACDLCERYGFVKPQAEQPQYSLIKREPVESEVMPVTTTTGMGLVVWSPLGQGMLTGKYDDGLPAGSRFEREGWLRERYVTEENRTISRRLAPIAEQLGITRGQLALAWVLQQPGISSCITGASKPEHVTENIHAAAITLDDATVAEIATIING